MAYPGGLDLSIYLVSTGLLPASSQSLSQQLMDMDGVMGAVSAEFERATGYLPFLSDGTSATRVFDGPEGSILQLRAGLISLSNLTINTTVYTENTQFVLQPTDGAARNLPYTYVDFGSGWGGSGYGVGDFGFGAGNQIGLGYVGGGRRAISITGVWGYASTLPLDVKDALLARACVRLAPRLALQVSGGLYSERRLNSETRYGGGKVSVLSQEVQMWQSQYEAAVNAYRLFRL